MRGGARPGAGRKPNEALLRYRQLAENIYGDNLALVMEEKLKMALDPETPAPIRLQALNSIEQRMLGNAAVLQLDFDEDPDGNQVPRIRLVVPQEVLDRV